MPPMAERSSTPGCMIGIVALIVFALVATWAAYTGYQQNKAIDTFTQPAPLTLPYTAGTPDEVVALRHRVRSFGNSAKTGESPTLKLSLQDLNDLIHHEDLLIDLRKMIVFDEIGEGTVNGRVALPMQTLFQGGKLRYLNGSIAIQPSVESGQIMLKVVSLTPDTGTTIPEGFFDYFSDNVNFIAAYRDDKQLSPIFERIRKVSVEDDHILVETHGP